MIFCEFTQASWINQIRTMIQFTFLALSILVFHSWFSPNWKEAFWVGKKRGILSAPLENSCGWNSKANVNCQLCGELNSKGFREKSFWKKIWLNFMWPVCFGVIYEQFKSIKVVIWFNSKVIDRYLRYHIFTFLL